MPPAPGVRERLESEGRWDRVVALHADALERGFNAPFVFNRDLISRDGADEIELRALCLLADFYDQEALRDSAEFADILFSRNEDNPSSMRDWYLENSYGRVDITGEVWGWYRMPEDYAFYVDSANGFGDYPRNAQRLVEDVLNAANEDVDFTGFDNDDNRIVEALFVVHSGPGAESTGSDNDIWSHAAPVPRNLRLDGMGFSYYAMEPEDGRIGVFGHELGHSLFGLPDLYDVNYNSAGVGFWSMMSGGSWGGGGDIPVHFDAWCKSVIGFLGPTGIIRNTTGLTINPVEWDDDVLQVWRQGSWMSQYFLLENRQRVGFDRSLPASGLLIWHIDVGMDNNSNPWWPENMGPRHNIVALEQADGAYHLERNVNSGDAGDPFPGRTFNFNFDAESNPSSRNYSNQLTDVAVINIESVSDTLRRFDVGVFPGFGRDPLSVFVLDRIPESHTYPHPDVGGDSLLTESELVRYVLRSSNAPVNGWGRELPENLDDYSVVIYLESWREGDEPEGGLILEEQDQLTGFLEQGKNLLLVGPDVLSNLLAGQQESPLYPYLMANLVAGGVAEDESDITLIRFNDETRVAGQSFPFNRGMCKRYVDEVAPMETGVELARDGRSHSRGVITVGENGYRVILQPFLFGGLLDWGGSKTRLMTLYFLELQYYLSAPNPFEPVQPPRRFAILQAWPNPFNGRVQISLDAAQQERTLNVLDALGRKVGSLNMAAGSRYASWQPQGMPAGSYWIRAEGEPVLPLRVLYLK